VTPLASDEVEPDIACDSDQPPACIDRDLVKASPDNNERLSNDIVSGPGVATPSVSAHRLEMLLMELVEAPLSFRCSAQ
jgi:hypothetical protein